MGQPLVMPSAFPLALIWWSWVTVGLVTPSLRKTSTPTLERAPGIAPLRSVQPLPFCKAVAYFSKAQAAQEPEMSSEPNSVESRFEQGLYASRWLMAPMYLGLAISLAMMAVVFVKELVYYVPKTLELTADQAILAALTLIDLSLAANLLLIVLFSGYENFVSKFDFDTGADRPAWMGKVDFSGLKMKLIASIVAISGIHLLKVFMSLGKGDPAYQVSTDTMKWMVIIHLTFVTSGVLLALMDWLTSKASEH
jgi:uncharacterized protein (TIGR00645 family)